jgi:hypothetical protein
VQEFAQSQLASKTPKVLISRRVSWILAGVILVLGTIVFACGHSTAKSRVRWLFSSGKYKTQVLSQPSAAGGDFKHIEWDGWGFVSTNTTLYLVFDPTDSLSGAASNHASGNFAGIPCEVREVHRLERQWYIVEFYTSQEWNASCD